MKNTLTILLLLSATMVTLVAYSAGTKVRGVKLFEPIKLQYSGTRNPYSMPQFCNKLSRTSRCPQIVSNGGTTYGGVLLPDLEWITDRRPNVRVSLFVREITNDPVANGGVETMPDDLEFIHWETTSPEADVENGGPYGWSLPGPGQTFDQFSPHGGPSGLMIYDALVFGACSTLNSFDISHEADVTEGSGVIGSFSGVDSSTIGDTGYYNMHYTLRATDSEGGVSDFHISGSANVICSGLNALP